MRGGPGSVVSATVRPGALHVNRTLFRGSLSLVIQTHGTFWLSGFLALPPLDLPTLLSHGMPCSLLLQFPLIPQNASGHPRGATQTRSPVSAHCPCGAACRFGFQPAGGLSPGLAPAWREQGPQGKGCRCPCGRERVLTGDPLPGRPTVTCKPSFHSCGHIRFVPIRPAAQPRPGRSNSRRGFTCSQFWRLDVQGGVCSS